MAKSYKDIAQDSSGALAKLRKDIPEVMSGFSALAQAATKDGALDKKTKELVAIALAVAARCDGCIGLHMQTVIKLGTTRAELLETLGMAIYMGGGPSAVYAADALKAFDELTA
ncbi:MAG: alkylhydroperoxidase [Gammaproteobacteria bacterium RIFCSPHIGHO2_12_FULL_41_20]|nr:MAG: alkylhydroperoxidase [Gammaproteobacteria bacterium RIFCSPHIGHO2_12_FULL_41_20]